MSQDRIGSNCVVFGKNSHTRGNNWCVLIGNNLTVSRPYRLRVRLEGVLEIDHVMSRDEAMNLVGALKKTLLDPDIKDGRRLIKVPEIVPGLIAKP